jgi:hypothetical protein
MAANDLVLVKPIITQTIAGVGSTTTHGVEEERTVGSVMTGAPATTTQAGSVRQMAFIAAAPVPFADLTAAANYVNSLRTQLIASGQMAAS